MEIKEIIGIDVSKLTIVFNLYVLLFNSHFPNGV